MTILLIMLMALQTFSKIFVLIEYQVNINYIAKNLCINRLKPSCCCRGKCYLNKKMAADESQQQTPGKSGQREESPLQLFTNINTVPELQSVAVVAVKLSRYLDPNARDFNRTVFQPPQA